MRRPYKLLALILLFVFTFNFSASYSFAQGARQKDASVVAINELSDVEGDEWAYKALQELVEKYDVLEGYPDGTFRGKNKATRFELAAAVYDLATYFSDEIALDREDLAKLAKLLDEFSTEIKDIQTKVDTLEGKVTTLETKTATLEGTVNEHTTKLAAHDEKLAEYEKRLAYAERRRGFLIERLVKGLVVDVRDLSRGIFAALYSRFNKDLSSAINQ